MKTRTTRVPPEVVPALIANISNHFWRVTWNKPEADLYTHFTGSLQMMERVDAFVQGFVAGQVNVEKRVKTNLTKLMSGKKP